LSHYPSQATTTVDFNAGDLVAGPGFGWSDVFDVRTLKVFGNMCRVPALSETFAWFALDSLVCLLMLWYCDHVLPSIDGHTHHPLFFLNIFYWFPGMRRSQAAAASSDDLVTVSNLGKSYSTGFLGFGKPVHALENVSFAVKRGTCLGLLGHNGTSSSDHVTAACSLPPQAPASPPSCSVSLACCPSRPDL